MKHFSILTSICIAASIFCSCGKDNVLYYNDTTMGNIVNGAFVTDDGLTYKVVEQECSGNLLSSKRAMIVSDVLKKTSDTSYEIRLKQYYDVLVKDILTESTITDKDALGHNAINIAKGWASGGYLNLLVDLTYSSSSNTNHLINLVYDDVKSNADTIKFTMFHNGYGETYEDEGAKDIAVTSSYASFPIQEFIPSGKDEVVVQLNWKWHKTVSNTLYPEIESHSTTGKIKRK